LEEETQGFLLRQAGAVAEGRDKLTARQGSSCPRAAVAPAAGGKDRLQRGRRSQTPSSLETCLGEMIRIAAPVATVKAITKAPARAVLTTREVTIKEATTKASQIKEGTTKEVTTKEVTTKEVTTKASQIKEGTTKEGTTREVTTRAVQTREGDANATTAKRSPTRMGEHTEHAEGRITLGATGAIQLDGETLDVVTCSLLKGFQTAPGPTELVHTTGSSSSVWFSIFFHIYFDLRFVSDYNEYHWLSVASSFQYVVLDKENLSIKTAKREVR